MCVGFMLCMVEWIADGHEAVEVSDGQRDRYVWSHSAIRSNDSVEMV
jgi:hypothetical protein